MKNVTDFIGEVLVCVGLLLGCIVVLVFDRFRKSSNHTYICADEVRRSIERDEAAKRRRGD